MKTYLVGGAVRDKLLGIEPKERDWVVVGSSPEEMKSKGFKQVGKDFPVFIHTKTGEEYALARTERKSGHGYTGFKFDTNSNVTLEEDLERRDLTINAIAEDQDGTLIDPYNGQQDIKNKKLRHVSNAFSEDPLRVLRLARFRTNLPNFEIESSTLDKVREIVDSGELNHLTGERIWLELYKAYNPNLFFSTLDSIGALKSILGNLYEGNYEYESEVDDRTFEHKSNKLHDLSYFLHTLCNYHSDNHPKAILGEDSEYSNQYLEEFCKKFKVPNDYKDLTKLLNNCYDDVFNMDVLSLQRDVIHILDASNVEMDVDEIYAIVKKLDIRKEDRLKNFLNHSIVGNNFETEFLEKCIIDIKRFKVTKEIQEKSNEDIQKIIMNAHKEIIKKHLINVRKLELDNK